MAKYIWDFTVSPSTITTVTITDGSTTVVVTKSYGFFETSDFVESDSVIIIAEGYNSVSARVGWDTSVTFTASSTITCIRNSANDVVGRENLIDANTLYNITDDTDVTLSLLELLYPVGSLYIASGNLSTCPLTVLGVGTWVLKTTNTIVTNISSTAPVKGNGNALGLTNGTENVGIATDSGKFTAYSNLFDTPIGTARGTATNCATATGITTDGTKSGVIADTSSLATTMTVTIWERIS